jgi:hypothetical protein
LCTSRLAKWCLSLSFTTTLPFSCPSTFHMLRPSNSSVLTCCRHVQQLKIKNNLNQRYKRATTKNSPLRWQLQR